MPYPFGGLKHGEGENEGEGEGGHLMPYPFGGLKHEGQCPTLAIIKWASNALPLRGIETLYVCPLVNNVD